MALITLSDITAKKDVSTHLGGVATQLIEEAELVDLKPLLGEKFYYDVVTNKNEAGFSILMNGGNYTYDGFDYSCPGLKRVLIEFAYGKIVFFGNQKSTPFGNVVKTYQDGQVSDRGASKERYTESSKVAMALWNDVKLYLDRVDLFDNWNCAVSKTSRGFKLTHIR
mgnify:CR=1 FL=1